MANTKISALTPGTPAVSSDILPIDRSGVNYSLTVSDLSTAAATQANSTVATNLTTNASPNLSLKANYWTGAASAADTWTIGSSLAAGTNGVSVLSFSHSGSTGRSKIYIPAATYLSTLEDAAALTLDNDFNNGGGFQLNFVSQGTLSVGAITGYYNNYLNIGVSPQGYPVCLTSNFVGQTGNACASIGNVSSFTATSGTITGLDVGGALGYRGLTFAPTSGTAAFVGLSIAPTINQTSTSSGSYTALKIAPVETSLKGSSNKLIDCYAGSAGTTEIWSVDNAGTETSYTANGAQWVCGSNSELLTLSTGGLTTDTVGNLLPANSIIESVVVRVTTTITNTTNWAVGDGTTSGRFASANGTLTAGTTTVGLNHWSGAVTTLAAGPSQSSASKVRITCTGSNPGAGAVRITVFYRTFVAPSS